MLFSHFRSEKVGSDGGEWGEDWGQKDADVSDIDWDGEFMEEEVEEATCGLNKHLSTMRPGYTVAPTFRPKGYQLSESKKFQNSLKSVLTKYLVAL